MVVVRGQVRLWGLGIPSWPSFTRRTTRTRSKPGGAVVLTRKSCVAHHPGLEPGSSRVTAGRLAIRPVVSAAQTGREPAWTGVLRTCGSLLRRLAASADRRTRTCTIRFWRPELYQLS